MEFTLPEKWKKWTIIQELGSGSYGRVYKIKNMEGEISTIKIVDIPQTPEEEQSIRHEYGSEELTKEYYNNLVTDFEEEIKILNSLKKCENIVRIYDFYKEEKEIGYRFYIQMEYLENFNDYCVEELMDEEMVIRFAIDICKALEQCHRVNIIHRDIKPENILVTSDGHLKLCDFGLARKLTTQRDGLSMKGTFTYMAPEIFLGKRYNAQVDIYSLGIILYRLMNHNREPFLPLNKKLIYFKDKEEAFRKRIVEKDIPVPVDASPEFADLILKAIAFDPKDRYPTATVMRKDLEKLSNGQYYESGLRNRRKRKLLTGLLALLLISVLAFSGLWNYFSQGIHSSLDDGVLKVWGRGTLRSSDVSHYKEDARKLIVSEDITKIEENAFADFVNLKTVELGDSIEEIGSEAFAGCSSLVEFRFPDKVTVAEEGVLASCSSMEKIDFNHVKRIKEHALEGCSSLNGSLDLQEMDELGQSAFYECDSLDQVFLPDALSKIPLDCFYGCDELQEVSMGENTSCLGTEAFQDCESLDGFDGLSQIEMFEDNALYNTKYLNDRMDAGESFISSSDFLICYNGDDKELAIPSYITKIGPNAFQNQKNGISTLKKVYIHAGVSMIGNDAFADCQSLKEIIFEDPTSIDSLGTNAFDGTSWLADQSDTEYVLLNDFLIAYNGQDAKLVLPDTIHRIAPGVFLENQSIESVTFNDHITEIGEYAFCSAENLEEVVIPNKEAIRKIGDYAFYGTAWLKKNAQKSGKMTINDEVEIPYEEGEE